MSIFLVETYLAKQERRTEFQKLLKEFLKFKKENPKVFEGLKSWKLLQQESLENWPDNSLRAVGNPEGPLENRVDQVSCSQ